MNIKYIIPILFFMFYTSSIYILNYNIYHYVSNGKVLTYSKNEKEYNSLSFFKKKINNISKKLHIADMI